MVMGWWSKIKAQKSTTWVPWVLITLMVWPARRCVAIPWRAGMMVTGEDIVKVW